VKISQPYPRDLQELQAAAETFWKKYVRSETLKNLIKSGPGQIKSVIKEVLRRENQGLKVYPVDGSYVFSMTGTYF